MKNFDRLFLIALVIVFAALAILEPSYGWRVRQWLSSASLAPAGGTVAAAEGGAAALVAQNEALKAQLAELQSVAAGMPQGSSTDPFKFIRAMVYSRYPFNFKNEFLVDAGALDGVALGQAATYNGIFVGTVTKTFPHEALIETVFDDNFKMAARIGSAGYDALVEGGAAPIATSIMKGAAVAPGEIVYSAAPGMQYGLPMAVVAATGTSPDDLFETASLGFAYDVNTVQSVLIER